MGAPFVSTVTSFTTDAWYRAASAGAFNAVYAPGSTFAAFCTFMLNGGLQNPGGVPVRQYLWGNSEDAAFSGWSIELVVAGGELSLQAKVGGAGAYVTVQEPLTGPLVVATGQVPASGAFNRLIMAMMWLDGTNLVLAINGTVCGFTAFDETTLTASALPPTLGAGTALVPLLPAGAGTEIVSCGYMSQIPFDGPSVGAGLAGSAFLSAQEDSGSGYVQQATGIDWTHRYNIAQSVQGLQGTISKTSTGASLTSVPVAPASLADVGGLGRYNLSLGAASPVALNRGGVSTARPQITQHKNLDWLQGGTFFFTP